MAGIGFELKKLFRSQNGYLSNIRGFAVSAGVTQGPMLLNIIMLFMLRYLLIRLGASYLEQEWFLYTITYATIFSLVFSNTFLVFADRFISDCIYRREETRIMSSFYTLLALLLGVFGLLAFLYIAAIPRSALYKVCAFVLFAELLLIWSEMSYLSALKQYGKILVGFFASVLVAMLMGFVLLRYTALDRVCAALLAVAVGYAIMGLMFFSQILLYYPASTLKLFDCFSALDEYKILIPIGLCLSLGLYAHNFVFWASDFRNSLWEWGVFCTKYDIPTFFATLTVCPMLVMFVVSLETKVYSCYRQYFDAILRGGSLEDIRLSRHTMVHEIFRESSHMLELQLFITIVCSTFLGNVLSSAGLDNEQVAIFRILCFGYCLYGLVKCLIIMMLYFEDRIGALIGSALFLGLSTVLTILNLSTDPCLWGLGFTVSAFLTAAYCVVRLWHFLATLEEKVFLRQPIFMQQKTGFFTRIAADMARRDQTHKEHFKLRHSKGSARRRDNHESKHR